MENISKFKNKNNFPLNFRRYIKLDDGFLTTNNCSINNNGSKTDNLDQCFINIISNACKYCKNNNPNCERYMASYRNLLKKYLGDLHYSDSQAKYIINGTPFNIMADDYIAFGVTRENARNIDYDAIDWKFQIETKMKTDFPTMLVSFTTIDQVIFMQSHSCKEFWGDIEHNSNVFNIEQEKHGAIDN